MRVLKFLICCIFIVLVFIGCSVIPGNTTEPIKVLVMDQENKTLVEGNLITAGLYGSDMTFIIILSSAVIPLCKYPDIRINGTPINVKSILIEMR